MFGNSDWFEATRYGVVAKPAGRSGWLYLLAWAGAVVVPALAIFAWNQGDAIAAGFWLLPATAMFLFDLRTHAKVANARQRSERDVFFIGFGDDAAAEVATPNYDLRLRR